MESLGKSEKIFYAIIFAFLGFSVLTTLSMLIAWMFGVNLSEFSWFTPIIRGAICSWGISLILLPFSLVFDEDEVF